MGYFLYRGDMATRQKMDRVRDLPLAEQTIRNLRIVITRLIIIMMVIMMTMVIIMMVAMMIMIIVTMIMIMMMGG